VRTAQIVVRVGKHHIVRSLKYRRKVLIGEVETTLKKVLIGASAQQIENQERRFANVI
jgi:REP element-mobilizing transposase RayT